MKTIISFILIIGLCVFISEARTRHTIKQDETLESIAKLYGVTPEQIKAANSQVRVFVSGVIINIPDPSPDKKETKTAKTVKTVANTPTSSTVSNKDKAEKDYNYWVNNSFYKDKSIRRAAAAALISAAENGHPAAQYEYYKYAYSGKIYKEIKKDQEKAMKMLFLSARSGYPEARWRICKESGYSSTTSHPDFPDKTTVQQWNEELIRQGHPEALYDRAHDYLYGFRGVQIDTLKAIATYERMIKEKNPKDNLHNYIYDNAFSTLERLIPNLPAKNRDAFRIGKDYEQSGQTKLATLYYKKAANDKYIPAMTALAELYSKQGSKYLANDWYEKAAANGDKKAIEYVAKVNQEKEVAAQRAAANRTVANAQPVKRKSKFDRIMDKIGEVMDVVGDGLDKMDKSLNETNSTSVSRTSSSSNATQNNRMANDEKMLSISSLISEYEQYKVRMIKTVGERDAKPAISDWNERIAWLNAKRRAGNNYVSESEWKRYTRIQDAKQKQRHEERMSTLKRRSERTQSTTKSFALSNYRQFEATLQSYHDYPDKYSFYPNKYSYQSDKAYLRKIQKQMREIRAEYGCSKSKWEDWDCVPGSMR